MPLGRFTLTLEGLHMDHAERRLLEDIVHFVGGDLSSFNEPLSTIEAGERAEHCSGKAIQLENG